MRYDKSFCVWWRATGIVEKGLSDVFEKREFGKQGPKISSRDYLGPHVTFLNSLKACQSSTGDNFNDRRRTSAKTWKYISFFTIYRNFLSKNRLK